MQQETKSKKIINQAKSGGKKRKMRMRSKRRPKRKRQRLRQMVRELPKAR